jgi:hypothetical protein
MSGAFSGLMFPSHSDPARAFSRDFFGTGSLMRKGKASLPVALCEKSLEKGHCRVPPRDDLDQGSGQRDERHNTGENA